MEYKIVPMTARHVPAIAALEQVCFSDPWSEAAIAPELDNPLSLWLTAEGADGAVLGYVGSQRVPPEADMMNIAVAPDARRQGIAEALVQALVQALDARGVTSLTLEVRVSNLPARALYKKLGFVQAGLRRNYYFHPKEDACILRKDWNA